MKRPHFIRLVCGFITATLLATTAPAQTEVTVTPLPSPVTTHPSPITPLTLHKLPVGHIQPQGWLREVLQRQRTGLNGQLGTVSAWLDKHHNQWLTDAGDHGWEEVPYWLRGYASLAYILDDAEMKQEAQTWFDAVLTNVKSDGFLGPRNTSNGRPEVWAQMVMLWALQTYYEHSGDERVLTAMTNYFKWEMTVPDSLFLEDYWENKRGGDNEWSVIWLYRLTGDQTLLPLIEKLHRNTCNWTLNDDLPNWHGVNIAQGFREPAIYYLYTGDKQMLQAAYDNHLTIRRHYGQVPGGMYCADENARQGYTDPRQGAETCAIVEQMASDEIMMGITGDPYWADHLEDVAFNTLPAALTPDMRALRYITSPNMAISDGPNHAPSIDNNLRGMLSMSPFSSRCCQHNHGMGWPYLAEHLVMRTNDNGLATMVYVASETTAQVGNDQQTVHLTIHGNYPFEEQIRITIDAEQPTQFPLYLRIPAWATTNPHLSPVTCQLSTKTPSLREELSTVNSQLSARLCRFAPRRTVNSPCYVRISRTWSPGDELLLTLPMRLSTRVWPENKGSISIDYGPLTLSLRIDERYKMRDSSDPEIVQDDSHWQPDVDKSLWPAFEIFPNSPWNYALVTDDQCLPTDFSVERRPWPSDNYPFTPDAVPLVFKAKGRKVPSWGFDATGMTDLLPSPLDALADEEETINLLPMGAARLRITAFPRAIVTNDIAPHCE